MLVASTRFGELEVSESDIIRFPHGVPGFLDEKAFIYLVYQPDSPFSFLQSVDNPDLTFLLTDPFAFFNDYEFALDDGLAQELNLSKENPPQIFNIVTHKGELQDMTVNLLAPIIINARDHIGVQIILEKSDYPTRHKLFPNGLPEQSGKEAK